MIFYSWSQSEDSSKGTELVTLKGKGIEGTIANEGVNTKELIDETTAEVIQGAGSDWP